MRAGAQRVNCVVRDPLLKEALLVEDHVTEGVFFRFTKTPLPPQKIDVFLLPFPVSSGEYADVFSSRVPVVGYGAQNYMEAAFLLGSMDYIKLPLTLEEANLRILYTVFPGPASYTFSNIRITPFHLEKIGKKEGSENKKERIDLSWQEWRVLELLLRFRGDLVPKNAFEYAIREKPLPGSRSVDVYISRLRKYFRTLGSAEEGGAIISVRGRGYRLKWSCS